MNTVNVLQSDRNNKGIALNVIEYKPVFPLEPDPNIGATLIDSFQFGLRLSLAHYLNSI